jgi:hypothetical protein
MILVLAALDVRALVPECVTFGAFVTALISTLEPLKHQLHIEMTQKLTSTDHLLKENKAKLVHSKVIV